MISNNLKDFENYREYDITFSIGMVGHTEKVVLEEQDYQDDATVLAIAVSRIVKRGYVSFYELEDDEDLLHWIDISEYDVYLNKERINGVYIDLDYLYFKRVI